MTDKVRRTDFSPDEYIAGVGGVLKADEQGVYWMICSLIMSEGKPIENNPRRIGGLCLIRPSTVDRIIVRLIDMGKLFLTGEGKISQNRSMKEVARSLGRINQARENGSRGGRRDAKSDSNSSETGVKLDSNSSETVSKVLPNSSETDEKPQQNQQKPKAGGVNSVNANHQPPTTNIKNSPKGESESAKKLGHRIPDDFRPDISVATNRGFGHQEAEDMASNFIDYWKAKPGAAARKLDWPATWRVWIRNSQPKSRPSPSRRQTASDILIRGGNHD